MPNAQPQHDSTHYARKRLHDSIQGTLLVLVGFAGIFITPTTMGQAASGLLMAFGALVIDASLVFRLPSLIREGVATISRNG